MKVIEIDGDQGIVEIESVRRTIGLQLLQEVKIGEYVIVHAGFAIEKLDEKAAMETLELLKDFPIKDII